MMCNGGWDKTAFCAMEEPVTVFIFLIYDNLVQGY